MNYSRRSLVQLWLASPAAMFAARKVPVAVQLYSIRKQCAADLPGSLAAVKKAGYQGVEFAGYHNRTAAELRKMLDDNGLKCCGTHTALTTLEGDELARTIEFNKTIGNINLIVPSLPKQLTPNRQAWLDMARKFNELAVKLKPAGMRVGYHNHSIEFQPLEGEMPWDTIFGNTVKEVVMQVDTGNCRRGDAEPLTFLKKYPGRAKSVHVKGWAKDRKGVTVGDDEENWKEIFAVCEQPGNTEWYIIEESSDAYPDYEGIVRSRAGLAKLGR